MRYGPTRTLGVISLISKYDQYLSSLSTPTSDYREALENVLNALSFIRMLLRAPASTDFPFLVDLVDGLIQSSEPVIPLLGHKPTGGEQAHDDAETFSPSGVDSIRRFEPFLISY